MNLSSPLFPAVLAATLLVGAASAQGEESLRPPRTAPRAEVPLRADLPDHVSTTVDARVADRASGLIDVRTPVHTAPDDPEGGAYGTWAAGASYKASFHDGFTFVPYLGGGYPHNQPLAWQTVSVTAGGEPIVDLAVAPVHRHGDYRYEYRYQGFVEAYDVRVDGVEQTFTIENRPLFRGDLVVAGRIATAMEAMPAAPGHRPITFRDQAGRALVHYGAAFALDAGGDTVEIASGWDGEFISLTVPGAWLDGAEFPVTIDPLLSRECVAFWSSVGLADGEVLEVEIGRDDIANQPMIAYTRKASASDEDLWVWLFDDDTMAFAGRNQIFTDITSTWGDAYPSIAFGGGAADKWIIAFNRLRVGTGGTNGARYHLHDSNDKTLSTSFSSISRPGGSSHGVMDVGGTESFATTSTVFVVYERDDSGSNTELFGKPIDLATNTQGTEVLIDVTQGPVGTGRTRRHPNINQISVGGSDGWVVAFQEFWDARVGGDDWDVNLVRIDGSGAVTGNPSYPTNATPDDTHKLSPVVAGMNGRYAVAMTTWGDAAGSKTTSLLGGRVMNQRFDWDAASSSATMLQLCDLTDGLVSDRRWAVTDNAYDNNSACHWLTMFHSTISGANYACSTGYDAGMIERVVPFAAGGVKAFAGAAVYNDDEAYPRGQFQLAYGTDEGSAACGTTASASHPVYSQRMDHLAEPAPTPYGIGCGGTIGMNGRNLAGYEYFGVSLTGATPRSVAGLLFSLGSANIPLDRIGMRGCSLLVDPALLVLSVTVPTSSTGTADVDLPLPTCPVLVRGTFYFQWAYLAPGANPLGVLATRGLRVTILP